MNKELSMTLFQGVRDYDFYFVMKKGAIGVLGFSTIHKCTAAMRTLAYGAPSDPHDDFLRVADSTPIESMYWFCKAVVAVFGPNYMRGPNESEKISMVQNDTT
jgi:hypothetical protein